MIGSVSSALSGLAAAQQRVEVAARSVSAAGLPPAEAAGSGPEGGVDLTAEMVALALSKRLYQANLSVVRTQDELLGSLLDVTEG